MKTCKESNRHQFFWGKNEWSIFKVFSFQIFFLKSSVRMVDHPFVQLLLTSKSQWMSEFQLYLPTSGTWDVFVFGECISRSCSLPQHPIPSMYAVFTYIWLFCYVTCKKQIPYTDGMGMQKGITSLKEMASLVMILQAIWSNQSSKIVLQHVPCKKIHPWILEDLKFTCSKIQRNRGENHAIRGSHQSPHDGWDELLCSVQGSVLFFKVAMACRWIHTSPEN